MATEPLDAAWREYSRQVLAILIRLLGDFELAEEALHDAFLAAARRWPTDGMPRHPLAWLVSAGRFSAIDKLRRRKKLAGAQLDIIQSLYPEVDDVPDEHYALADDRLRLIFVCCHPMLTPEAQIALTLREVCGLTTEDIARAFLPKTPTIAQRIVRAKLRLKQAAVPYTVPERAELAERLDSVLHTIYLVFNEGYLATSGSDLVRENLCAEAIRLCRLLADLLPEPEVHGLLGMMLLHDARRPARQRQGDMVLLPDQDRTLWSRPLIEEGTALIERAFASGTIGPYTIQGAIAAVHCTAPSAASTNWSEIVALYDLLLTTTSSAVVRLNRAVAVFMRSGSEAGMEAIEPILAAGELDSYLPAQAAAAEIYFRAGHLQEAKSLLERALALCANTVERQLLAGRLQQFETADN